MAKQSYDEALRRVLVHEGGYTNHPSDPGGPTNFGITIYDARKYWKADAIAADVRAMPLSVAKDIYRRRYWDAQRADELPPGVDYSTFDYGVNSGIGRSGKVLRRLVGQPADTSAITPEVIAAARKRDPQKLVNAINDERIAFLRRLRTWPVFGGGWGRRVTEVRGVSLRMARGIGDVGATGVVSGAGKGRNPAPTTATHGTAAGAGSMTAAAGWAVGTHLGPWLAALIVVLAVVLVAGALWGLRRRAARLHEDVSHIEPLPEAAAPPATPPASGPPAVPAAA